MVEVQNLHKDLMADNTEGDSDKASFRLAYFQQRENQISVSVNYILSPYIVVGGERVSKKRPIYTYFYNNFYQDTEQY